MSNEETPTQRQIERAEIMAGIPVGWFVIFEGARCMFRAISPDWEKDGVVVEGRTVEDTIFRVQALLLNWQPGDVVEDPTVEIEKRGLTKPEGGSPTLAVGVRTSSEEAQRKLLEVARLQGFEGEFCRECGRATLIHAGTCLKCVSCGWGGECA